MKGTKTYKQIVEDQEGKTYPIPYYSDTGLFLSDDIFDDFLEKEVQSYLKKYKGIIEKSPDFKMDNLRERVEKHVRSFKGKNYLIVEYAYVDKNTIDDAIQETESRNDFVKWLCE